MNTAGLTSIDIVEQSDCDRLSATAKVDILGFGAVAVDDLFYVPVFPAADAKVQIVRRTRQCGGLTGTALVAAARAGVRCAYAGALGDDPLSQFVEDCFVREGLETSTICRIPGARPIHSTIVVDDHRTRTIFYDLDGVTSVPPDWPVAEVIRESRVLFVDHFDIHGMLRAARIARDAGVAVVADFEIDGLPRCLELLPLVDHLVVSLAFARRITGAADAQSAAKKLWNSDRQAVVLTEGASGCWYLAADEPAGLRHQPAFAMPVVDTTGCGDVFHGSYAAALVLGREPAECIRYAAAAAALKAACAGGQQGIPTRAAVDQFLRGHGA